MGGECNSHGEMRNECSISVVKPEGKGLFFVTVRLHLSQHSYDVSLVDTFRLIQPSSVPLIGTRLRNTHQGKSFD
jgi:hypothetical protein